MKQYALLHNSFFDDRWIIEERDRTSREPVEGLVEAMNRAAEDGWRIIGVTGVMFVLEREAVQEADEPLIPFDVMMAAKGWGLR